MTSKRIPSVYMYVMNIQNDVIGLVLHQNCKSQQGTDFIAWPSRCHVTIHCTCTYITLTLDHNPLCRGTIFLCRTNVGWRCYCTSIHCTVLFPSPWIIKKHSINLKVTYLHLTWIKKFLTRNTRLKDKTAFKSNVSSF